MIDDEYLREASRIAEKLHTEYGQSIIDKGSFYRAGQSFFEKAADGKGFTEKRRNFLGMVWDEYKYPMAKGGAVPVKSKGLGYRQSKAAKTKDFVGWDKRRRKTTMVYAEKYLRQGKEVIRYRDENNKQRKLFETVQKEKAAHRRYAAKRRKNARMGKKAIAG